MRSVSTLPVPGPEAEADVTGLAERAPAERDGARRDDEKVGAEGDQGGAQQGLADVADAADPRHRPVGPRRAVEEPA